MSGTREGGLKAAATNRAKYGDNFYAVMGAKGGVNGHTGGFASNRELARQAGIKGGKAGKRGASVQRKLDEMFVDYIKKMLDEGRSIRYIAQKIGVCDGTIKRFIVRHGWLPDNYTKNV